MLALGPFGGIAPAIEPHLLPDNGAQVALNCELDSGSIRPLKAPSFVWTPTKAGEIKTIYRYGAFWFHWLNEVNIVRCPLDTSENLVVYTGEGVPKLTYASIATAGGNQYPTNNYDLGTPIPSTAPGATVTGAASEDDPIDVAYLVTFTTSYAGLEMEGAPSLPSGIVSVNPGQSVDLSLPSVPLGNRIFTSKNIYRSVGGTIKRIASVAPATASYSDPYSASEFGVDLVTDNWYPPPSDLKEVISLPGGVLAGISGKNVCFSVPYQVHAWPPDWRKPVTDNPVALVAFGNTILVLTDGRPEVGIGTSNPEGLMLELIEMDQSCTHPRAAVDMGYAACFPTPDGLFIVGQEGTSNVTEKLFRKEQFNPPLFGAAHDGKYYGFRADGGFIFDPRSGSWLEHDIVATAAWQDYMTDNLYVRTSQGIMLWEGGDPKQFTWKSKKFRTPPMNFPVCRVVGTATVTYSADGADKHTQAIADDVFRLPSGFLAREHELEVEGSSTVDSVILGRHMRDVA